MPEGGANAPGVRPESGEGIGSEGVSPLLRGTSNSEEELQKDLKMRDRVREWGAEEVWDDITGKHLVEENVVMK